MTKPSREQIDKAGRQLQRGGFLGRGSSKLADELIEQAEEAGLDGRDVAFHILGAAAEHKPRWSRQ